MYSMTSEYCQQCWLVFSHKVPQRTQKKIIKVNFLLLSRVFCGSLWYFASLGFQLWDGEGQQRTWRGMNERQQLRKWGVGWGYLDRCLKLRCSPRGTTPLPHWRKSSEDVSPPGSHRSRIMKNPPTSPHPSPPPTPPPPHGPECPHHPATRLICQAQTSSCYTF